MSFPQPPGVVVALGRVCLLVEEGAVAIPVAAVRLTLPFLFIHCRYAQLAQLPLMGSCSPKLSLDVFFLTSASLLVRLLSRLTISSWNRLEK